MPPLPFSPTQNIENPFLKSAPSDAPTDTPVLPTADQSDPANKVNIGPNHVLTKFSKPRYDHFILDQHDQQMSISLSAQLHGSFFLDDGQRPGSARGELTCYRRNIYHVTGNVTLPRASHFILTEDGRRLPISDLELSISAIESTEGAPAKIVSIPQKPSSVAGSSYTSDRTERDPQPMPLDFTEAQTVGGDFANFPFEWKRLRFRSATANNGRRKELQQHYTICIGINARVAGGQPQRLCSVQSNPIIVRGRNPGNFQPKKETPIRAPSTSALVPGSISPPVPDSLNRRRSTNASAAAPLPSASIIDPEPSVAAFSEYSFEPSGYFSQIYTGNATNNPINYLGESPMTSMSQISPLVENGRFAAAAAAVQSNRKSPPATVAVMDTSFMDMLHNEPNRRPSVYRPPIPLSLVDDDETPPRSTPSRQPSTSAVSATAKPSTDARSSSPRPLKRRRSQDLSRPGTAAPQRRVTGSPPTTVTASALCGPDEAADALYEYFPLSFDEWLPPVQAIYRPHAVHHCVSASDPRERQFGGMIEGRSIRYFSEQTGVS